MLPAPPQHQHLLLDQRPQLSLSSSQRAYLGSLHPIRLLHASGEVLLEMQKESNWFLLHLNAE